MSLDNDEVLRVRSERRIMELLKQLPEQGAHCPTLERLDQFVEKFELFIKKVWLDGYEAGKRDEYVRINTRESKE